MRYQTATQWGVYDVEVCDGKIVGLHYRKEDPAPSNIGRVLTDGVQHKLRVERPAIRKSWLTQRDRKLRGAEPFVEVPWDEALDLAGEAIAKVIDEYGNRSIFAGSYGWASAGRFHHAQSQLHRFINLLGGATRAMNTYSTAAAQVVLPHVVAPWHQMELEQTTWAEIAEHAEIFVAFGGIPLRNTQVAYGGITQHESEQGARAASQAGVTFINISPVATDVSDWLNAQWMPCRPGTDVALMLGMAYVLETEDLLDRAFLDSHCAGYAQFRNYLLGRTDGMPKTPQWAFEISDVPALAIAALARQLAAHKTFLSAAWSLQRAHHGEQPYWMLVTLASMLGQIGEPGCGFGFGYGAEGFIGSSGRRFNWATFSKGQNPTQFAIPVARIADMLLHPGETIAYDGRGITYPNIQLIYWAGGNPFHHHQDLNRLVEAWRKPETVIVNEPWWTPTAQWADIVFPATTSLERQDICASSHDPFAHAMERALPPQHEARSDHDIFKGLAARFDRLKAFDLGLSEREWLEDLWQRSAKNAHNEGFELPSFDQFWSAKSYRLPENTVRTTWLKAFKANPGAHPLKTPSGKIELFSETIAAFGYEDCPGHATWLEPFERLGGEGCERFPLHLLTPQPAHRLHSQFDHSAHSQDSKIKGKEVLTLHPAAAAVRGIGADDIVRVFNDRGACLAGACLSDQMRPDVVSLPTGAWFAPQLPGLEVNGNPNVLTCDKGTSQLAQGPSSGTCLVEVELYSE